MSDIKKVSIQVGTKTTFMKWVRTLLSMLFAVMLPVGIGIYAQSSAMQWVGFSFGVLAVLGWAVGDAKRTTFETYDEAISFLQKEKSASRS